MARVRATQTRIICQYRDAAGHRLPSRKGMWDTMMPLMEADCPKCPEPQPEPVECERPEYHDHHAEWARYCPSCGKRLLEA